MSRRASTTSLIALAAGLFASVNLSGGAGAQTYPVIIAPGFEFNLFADPTNVPEFAAGAFTGPTAIAFDSRGRLFASTYAGRILILLDTNDDGRADQVKTFATGVPVPLGMTFRSDGDLFVTSNILGGVGRIVRLRDTDGDDVVDERTTIVDGLPSEGDHQTDRLRFGPDSMLYFGQGSSTDNGTPKPGRPAERPLNATILRVDIDNPAVHVFASGLRNPFGMAFHPESGLLFATDGGSGEICQIPPCPEDLSPPEEINWVVEGGNYGFPQCEGTPMPDNPGCQGVRPSTHQFAPHLTPTSIAFYTGPQAAADQNLMLVTLFKRYRGQGGDLRRLQLVGSPATGFQAIEVLPRIADFGIIDPGDGPVDTAIDPISGDIYVARFDAVAHLNLNEHHHFIYRIHRAGSDGMPFIGPPRPSGVHAGEGGATINLTGRHLKPGALVLANGLPIPTRQGSSVFELVADLPASETETARTIIIEVINPDGSRSNQQTFTVEAPPPPPEKSPKIDTAEIRKKGRVVNPVVAGSKPKKLRLVVIGTDFDSGAQLLAAGQPVELVSASQTEMVGRVTKAMIATPGELTVQVRNSTGKVSNIVNLLIVAGEEFSYGRQQR